MKKLPAVLWLALVACMLVSCAPAGRVSAVEWYALPAKSVYTVGEAADFSGARALVRYSDGGYETVEIAPDQITGFDSSSPGERVLSANLRVDGRDWTLEFRVTVRDAAETLTILSLPAARECLYGDTPDVAGGVLLVRDAGGASREVPFAECEIACDTARLGLATVRVGYRGQSVSYTVTVRDAPAALEVNVLEPEIEIVYDELTGAEEPELGAALAAAVRMRSGASVPVDPSALACEPILPGRRTVVFGYGDLVARAELTVWYLIDGPRGWAAMNACPDGWFRLTGNLDFGGAGPQIGVAPSRPDAANPAQVEIALGGAGTAFTGRFDGGGYILMNYLDDYAAAGAAPWSPAAYGRGLFGWVGASARIGNFTLRSSAVRAGKQSGLLAAVNEGTIYDVCVEADCSLYIHYRDGDLVYLNAGLATRVVSYVERVGINPAYGEDPLSVTALTGGGELTQCRVAPGEDLSAQLGGGWRYFAALGTVLTNADYARLVSEAVIPLGGGAQPVFALGGAGRAEVRPDSPYLEWRDGALRFCGDWQGRVAVGDRIAAAVVYAGKTAQSVVFTVVDGGAEVPVDLDEFNIVRRQWGGACNAGVIAENVTRAGDDLILIANGDYYTGPKRGVGDYVGTYGGTRTGAAIRSKETYGPGSFEVRMKLADRNGVCNAMWLYNNFASGGAENHNYEIDIEIHGTVKGGDGFDTVLCTNWVTERAYAQTRAEVGALNDGEFHAYRFDWHTGSDPRVEYYVDGTRVAVLRDQVPTNEMYFWLGVWFPDQWCGTPDFDTSAMTVRSFRYTPFADERAERIHCERTEDGAALDPTVAVPELDYISAADLTRSPAWLTDGVFDGGLRLGSAVSGGYAQQTVRFDCGGLAYRLAVTARGAALSVIVHYYDREGALLARDTFDAPAAPASATSAWTLAPPGACTALTLMLRAETAATLARVSLLLA